MRDVFHGPPSSACRAALTLRKPCCSDVTPSAETPSLPRSGFVQQFDARNRLESLTGSGSASYSFGYDLSDTRVRVTEGRQVTEFGVAPLGGMSQVLTEKLPRPGNVEKTYVYTPNGQLLFEVETSTVSAASTVEDEETGETFAIAGGSPARYFHYDMTGSTVAVTDEDNAVIGRVYYTPYGEITARSGSTDTRFLF